MYGEMELFRSAVLFWSYTKFRTVITQRRKIIKLNQLYLYDIQTDHIQTLFYKHSKTFILFYDLRWRSKYENQKRENLLVLFISNFLLMIYPGWDLA